eukprot:TRINITY_DN7978_c0_g1_i2.p1 TRINITY_DN7978_c0_g1~~TRINITY_DN7978_c0_g1_i2.p1  ORF type:complete len:125 (+),score=19.27 TRINITY_DN7978_c0_g1_i2:433-807(+)
MMRPINVEYVFPDNATLYRLSGLWAIGTREESKRTTELRLPPPLPHTDETSARGPARTIRTTAEIDKVLADSKTAEADPKELLATYVQYSKAVRKWMKNQHAHRINRYKYRLRIIFRHDDNTHS